MEHIDTAIAAEQEAGRDTSALEEFKGKMESAKSEAGQVQPDTEAQAAQAATEKEIIKAVSALTNLSADVQTQAEAEAARQALYDYMKADESNKTVAYNKAMEQLRKSISSALETKGLDAGTRQRLEGILDNIDSKGEMGDNEWQGISKELERLRAINGLRTSRYRILTQEEIDGILNDIKKLEADPSIFRFNRGNQTGFLDNEGIINVRGDVLPDLNSTHPRDLMSQRAVIAHEYYGHKYYNDKFGNRNPMPGSWNDEFRASYNAAINAPNLSDMDRMYLMMDALERAKEAGVNIRITETIRRILYGY